MTMGGKPRGMSAMLPMVSTSVRLKTAVTADARNIAKIILKAFNRVLLSPTISPIVKAPIKNVCKFHCGKCSKVSNPART